MSFRSNGVGEGGEQIPPDILLCSGLSRSIQWADRVMDAATYMGIYHGCIQLTVPQKRLDLTYMATPLKKVSGEAVTQAVNTR